MSPSKEYNLIAPGVPQRGGRWADLGSGGGAFTLPLAQLLGPEGEIYSVDWNPHSLETQRQQFEANNPQARVHYLPADFTQPLDLPPLDGILMANSLHFQERQEPVLARALSCLKPGGRLIVVEYNTNLGNHWVPYPIDLAAFQRLALRAGFVQVRLLARVPSRFLGEMYSCLGLRPEAGVSDPRV